MALVILCCSPGCSLCCDLPLSHNSQKTFSHLSPTETISLLSCLKPRTDFRFLQIFVDMNQLQKTPAAILRELLQKIFNLFSTNTLLSGEDETLLDKFLSGLNQPSDVPQTCLEKEKLVEQIQLGI
uniref:Interferon 1CA1 n=1 Tax=Procavia capensis TaxID=9813 RepID=A0A7R8GV60_PROCA|nr:TPA: interferon 1CA1 [Procavia capensis]